MAKQAAGKESRQIAKSKIAPVGDTYYELQQSRKLRKKARSAELFDEAPGASAIYFWDTGKGQFIAPNNLTTDPNTKSGSYVIEAAVFSFHSSAADMSNLFSDNANNVQVNFRAEAKQDGELITWIVNAALSTAQQWLTGPDKQLVSTGNNPNQLTNIPSPQDQIVVSNGRVTIALGLQAQKKDSWWDTFLKAIGAVANSPLFAVVPMSKLIGQTVDAITQMTNKIEQAENLIPILQGNKLECRIYDGATTPYVLKEGYWLMANYNEIASLVEWPSENLKSGIILDFGAQQYSVIDMNANHIPVDATYVVVNIAITSKTA